MFCGAHITIFQVIGLTGGIATGKSTVSQLLSNKYKLPVIDADFIARQVVAKGTPCLERIVDTFGPSVLFPDGSLDRKKLGNIIFNDPAKRKQLNAIVHPAVRRAMAKALFMLWMRGEKISILDVPLLIEEGMWKWVAKVIVVYWSVSVASHWHFKWLWFGLAARRKFNCSVL